MMYPLEAPNGWFLWHAKHEHTSITMSTDFHEPLPHATGPWIVGFQKYPKGGMLQEARGHSLEEAWENASQVVAKYEMSIQAHEDNDGG